MSVSYIPQDVRYRLWGKAAGRCQYRGCNTPLWIDKLTKAEFNSAYIAHIIADKPSGPRGDVKLSILLGKDISNIMLLCDAHHRLIDIKEVEGHPVELLQEMKKEHENRIELITEMDTDRESHVVLFGTNIGDHSSPLNKNSVYPALKVEKRYPAQVEPIALNLDNSLFKDNDEFFWTVETKNLQQQFKEKVEPILSKNEMHFSLFGIAPQPLLIKLGKLFSDIPVVETFQRQREPEPTWEWSECEEFTYIVKVPEKIKNKIALIISLSGAVTDDRIVSVLGEDISIWTLTIDNPNNDFLKSKHQLSEFRQIFRKLLNDIKFRHGQNNEIHVFPAAPVAVNIEIGRAWMPKADLPMRIYDQNYKMGGFQYALTIR
ncbi:SAVED domain-containing protein [Sporosarcina sp. FSL K6-6792]|uniref:SAVED domain-containing protein n=1 Tax=Sporosarcina sp. FSL K6-6792 TaxID=2921559 RepID=UPI0030F6006A